MIGFSGYFSGAFDPDPEFSQGWSAGSAGPVGPQDPAPVQPDPKSPDPKSLVDPLALRALAEFEQLLHEWDSRTTVAQMLDELDKQLGRLRPGGPWMSNEEEAVKLLRLLAYRMRRKLL